MLPFHSWQGGPVFAQFPEARVAAAALHPPSHCQSVERCVKPALRTALEHNRPFAERARGPEQLGAHSSSPQQHQRYCMQRHAAHCCTHLFSSRNTQPAAYDRACAGSRSRIGSPNPRVLSLTATPATPGPDGISRSWFGNA